MAKYLSKARTRLSRRQAEFMQVPSVKRDGMTKPGSQNRRKSASIKNMKRESPTW